MHPLALDQLASWPAPNQRLCIEVLLERKAFYVGRFNVLRFFLVHPQSPHPFPGPCFMLCGCEEQSTLILVPSR